MGDVVV